MNFPHFRRFGEGISFSDALAGLLLANEAADPLERARTLVLLPSRRACRSLREALLRQSEGAPQLLPRILPIGEVENEMDLFALAQTTDTLPPEMPACRRLAILTRLIIQSDPMPPSRALQLAVELARLLDEVNRHNLSFAALKDLVPEPALHWEKITEFLGHITRQWPRKLAEHGMEDSSVLMRKRTRMLAEHWRNNPPDFPVIAAGSTGSIPATAELLIAIAHMPRGMVILPGLDAGMKDEAWELLEATHPQHGLRQLLHRAGAERQQVELLSPSIVKEGMRAMFAPAPLTAQWREEKLNLVEDCSHISLMQADTQLEEARMIAYQLRAALETPGKTAALVTPDRTLARMVASECARYGLSIDDSAGKPLIDSPPAIFMRLLLEVMETGCSPTTLLALLRHPFAALGTNTAEVREYSRALEEKFLRGVRFESGMDALADAIKTQNMPAHFMQLTDTLRACLRPLEMLFLKDEPCSLSTLIHTHITVAEALAGTEPLWAKEDGAALATLLAQWHDEAPELGDVRPFDYPALFDVLLAGEAVRKPFGTHPRLHILSPIEARLTHYDVMILGELNEGTWPAGITVDPWMSNEMRETFGLPSHASAIGQSAHDVWMLLHAPRVILTRAKKIFGRPQEPSRWWVRLTTLVKGKDEALLAHMDISAAMRATIAAQDAPHTMKPLKKPAPVPPLSARPKKFSPTAIELWEREPYAFYAQKILGLYPLAPLDQEPDAADFGKIIHAALEHFAAEHPAALPPHAYQLLLAHGERMLKPYMNKPAVAALWWPRFEAIARHWLARETVLRAQIYTTTSEVSANWSFAVEDTDVSLYARADRIDRMQDGFRLIDYKTGTPPTAKKVEGGEAKQLPLTALALIRSGAVEATPKSLVYWALKTREKSKDFVEVEASEALLASTENELKRMIAESLSELTSYAPPTLSELPDSRDEYDHLIRRAEWGAG